MLIAVSGFAGSGKGAIGKILTTNYGFLKDSFAAPLKDACAAIFNWPRDLLEGETEESRIWRENVDKWWAEKLNIPNFSPRWALQHIGTNVFRRLFNDKIWLISLENRFIKSSKNIIVTDCRFFNEMILVRSLGGSIIQVTRGDKPKWWDIAKRANLEEDLAAFKILEESFCVHSSEYSWIGFPADYYIENNGTLEDLKLSVDNLMSSINLT